VGLVRVKEANMCARSIAVLALGVAAAIFAVPASAITCYTLLDSKDNVLYRGYQPPVDMSAAGAAARAALRQKHEFLMVSDANECILVASPSKTGNYGPASVEEIVAGLRPFASTSGVARASGGAVVTPVGPRVAPAPTVRSGPSQRGY
jgi:hypothetical protein